MPITEHQRRQRQKHIGSSDSPAIVGVSPFASIGDVYHSKVHDLPSDRPTAAMTAGNLLEGTILGWAADRLGVQIMRNQLRVSRGSDDGILAASFDALVRGKPEAMEAKYTTRPEDWGEEGTDQVPDHVMVQCQHQAYVGELDAVWVPVLMLGFRAEFRLFRIERHEDLIRHIVDRDVEFWNEHVLPRIPPDGAAVPPMSILKSMNRISKTVALDEEALSWVAALEVAKQDVKAAKEREEEAKRGLIDMLGEADAGELPDGRLLTFLEQRSSPRADLKRLRIEHPDIYAELVTQGSHRTLRVKKAAKTKRGEQST